ncbi:MAG TPA: glutathione S-transferase family protein, partial [Thermoanaerobaculia bacterium]|nr:glutathione S-transferase family protein [Thermoanaerobaculia bacterium]
MALTFYYGAGSPFAWRVWLALEHKAVPYQARLLSFDAGELRTPEFTAINPRRKVPAIVDDGFALYESAAIVEYLDERFEGAPLFPGDARQRALVRRIVSEVDSDYREPMERLVRQVFHLPPEGRDASEIAAGSAALAEELAFWERVLAGDFLAGELSAADHALYPMIGLSLRMERLELAAVVDAAIGPKVRAWMRRIEALPYFAKTWPAHW